MYSLEEALKKQIQYCHYLPKYRCGVYIKEHKKLVAQKMFDLLTTDNEVERKINSRHSPEVHFKNGSYIRIIDACDNARGQKNHGVIIDKEINDDIVKCIIMPSLTPRWYNIYSKELYEEVKKRIFIVNLYND